MFAVCDKSSGEEPELRKTEIVNSKSVAGEIHLVFVAVDKYDTHLLALYFGVFDSSTFLTLAFS